MFIPSIQNRALLRNLLIVFALITLASLYAVLVAPVEVSGTLGSVSTKYLLFLVWETIVVLLLTFLYFNSFRPAPIDMVKYCVSSMFVMIAIGGGLPLGIFSVNMLASVSNEAILFDVKLAGELSKYSALVPLFFLVIFVAAYIFLSSPYGDEWARKEPD